MSAHQRRSHSAVDPWILVNQSTPADTAGALRYLIERLQSYDSSQGFTKAIVKPPAPIF
jgi:hypothetical protein